MHNKGFSIAELIVVLILAAIAIVMVTPSLSRAFRRTGVRSAMDQFASTHSLARSAAVRYGRTAQLYIDTLNGRFWVEVDTSGGAGKKDTVGVVKYAGAPTVTLRSTRTVLCFDARGLPSSKSPCQAADATLIFTSANKVDTLTITALGRVLR
jgi:prepilin-type N-terminal cleavage/methylation domain-containing protein